MGEGGLAAAVAHGAFRFGVGARIVLDEVVARDGVSLAEAWFSETQGRVLVALPRTEEPRWTAMLEARGVPFARIGTTTEEPTIELQGAFTVPLAELREVWESQLPSRFA